MDSKAIVMAFWQAMQSNDFAKASEWLSPDFEGFWPQSKELIAGPANFAAINSHYPANGRWQFTLHSVVAEGNIVVTDVSITDGKQQARAITFHRVKDGLIQQQTEFWPDPMAAQRWRSQWVEIDDQRVV